MEYIIIGLLAVAIILLIVVIAKQGKKTGGAEEELRIRNAVNDSVGSNIKNLGEMLSTNQKDATQAQLNQMKLFEERLKTLETTNEQKLDAMRVTIDTRLNAIREDNNKELDKIRGTVDEKLQKTLEDKMNASFKMVSERLEQVYKGLGEMQTMASNVGDLKKVLSNVKSRGIVGEIQLGAILTDILSPEQFGKDVVVDPATKNVVEYAVKLPGEDGESIWLPIDSKFPGDAYSNFRDAVDTANPELIKEARAILFQRIKGEAKDISTKYISVPYTTNFAIMFLPFEGLYAEVINDTALVEELQKKYKINVAGPSTMAALLNSLQMGFRTLAIQKRSAEVWKVLGAVRTEFDKFDEVLINAQKKLNGVNKELDDLVGVRTRAITRQLKNVERLDDNEATSLLGTGDIL